MTMLNPFKRSISIPGELGACLVTGTEKIRCGYGNGDCLLLDFRHGIFAVADAAERFPQASRLLLERLVAETAAAGPPASETEFESLLCRAWSRQKFIHKTTLSCVVLLNGRQGPAAMLANNGDSTITLLDPGTGATLFQSRSDMNFAGRSRHPNPVSIRGLTPGGATIVLATDGLADMGEVPTTTIARQPDRLAGWIGDRMQAASAPSEVDDVGAIALSSAMPAAATDTVIMGGTRPKEETGFIRHADRRPAMDRWDSFSAWRRSADLAGLAGIRFR
jgi:hypothetical protein